MNRRELIQYTAWITGAAVCTPLISILTSSCSNVEVKNEIDYVPCFFEKDAFNQIKELVDIILPKTESPSASEVGVHQTIDQLVGTAYRAEEKASYQQHYKAFASFWHKTGIGLSDDQKTDTLIQLSQSSDPALAEAKAGFLQLRQQTVAIYLLSEQVATTYLNYLPIPGTYESCIPLDEDNQKAWAL